MGTLTVKDETGRECPYYRVIPTVAGKPHASDLDAGARTLKVARIMAREYVKLGLAPVRIVFVDAIGVSHPWEFVR